MSIADRNLVDELSSGDVTLPKLGKVIASLYLQTDRQGAVQIEQGRTLARLEAGQVEQTKINSATLTQTTATNGQVKDLKVRVGTLEDKTAKTVSCPGKCIPLASEIESLIPRIEALEEPVHDRNVVAAWFQTRWGIVTAITTVLFGLFAIPGINDYVFSKKQEAIAQAALTKDDIEKLVLTKDDIAKIVSEQIQIAQQKNQPTPTKKP